MKTFNTSTCIHYQPFTSCTHSKEINDAWGQWMQFIHLGSVPGSAELGPSLWPTGPLRQGWSGLCCLPPPQAHWCRSPLSEPPTWVVDFPHSQWIHPKSIKACKLNLYRHQVQSKQIPYLLVFHPRYVKIFHITP